MLVKIKNAQQARLDRVLIPFSKTKFAISQILHTAGFVGDIERRKKKIKKSEFSFIEIKLQDAQSLISGIKLISKPSRRVYIKKGEIKPVKSGYGLSVISTSKGLMTGAEARKVGLGGELIFEIW